MAALQTFCPVSAVHRAGTVEPFQVARTTFYRLVNTFETASNLKRKRPTKIRLAYRQAHRQ